jgi:hypothetical protein
MQETTTNQERNITMQILEKPVAKRKFSQSCNSKQEFFDLLVELRDKAEKKQYNPENTFSKEYQQGFGDGEWSVLNSLIDELAKSPDSRTY